MTSLVSPSLLYLLQQTVIVCTDTYTAKLSKWSGCFDVPIMFNFLFSLSLTHLYLALSLFHFCCFSLYFLHSVCLKLFFSLLIFFALKKFRLTPISFPFIFILFILLTLGFLYLLDTDAIQGRIQQIIYNTKIRFY